MTFRLYITNNPYPGPPPGEGAFFCGERTVGNGAAWAPMGRLRQDVIGDGAVNATVEFGRGMDPGSRGSK